MPRPPRADEAGGLYHALNRGDLRACSLSEAVHMEMMSGWNQSPHASIICPRGRQQLRTGEDVPIKEA